MSILETLRHDLPGHVAPSESALTHLSGASRTAVRRALAALVLEVAVGATSTSARDHAVHLRGAGRPG